MTLNKRDGEILGDLGTNFTIEPNTKWRATRMWDIASELAIEAFYEASRQPGHFAFHPGNFTDDQIIVQSYPESPGNHARLAFVFSARIAGQDYYHPVVFSLPPKTLGALKLAGLWIDRTVH